VASRLPVRFERMGLVGKMDDKNKKTVKRERNGTVYYKNGQEG